MKCDLGNLVPFYNIHLGYEMMGHWFFEQCPHHRNTRAEISECEFCDNDGQIEVFIECDEKDHEEG